METPRMPSAEHIEFDAICAPVEDFEPLPTVRADTEVEEDEAFEEPYAPLDGLILAGLVEPH